jgi:ubiquinone/menaquinone biosynthesis C-methylase UbiE
MDFKGRAKTWDSDSMIKRSDAISKEISEILGNKETCDIMEYGCATGLISFNLCDKFKTLTLMDSEEEMLDVVKEKIEYYKTTNVIPKKIDLTKEKYLDGKFDIIYTSMTLHHILDTESIVKTFYSLLEENGILCVVELDKEDGSFHMNEKNFDGHNGFEHSDMEKAFKEAGFEDIESKTFFNGEKIYKENIIPYSLFYTIGKKI